MRSRTVVVGQVFWRTALLYLLSTAIQLHGVASSDAGFSYALDLPYVQLAVAQHLAHGTYGINAVDTASPVASLIWPFLLVPFAWGHLLVWAPLFLNMVAGLCTCVLVGIWIDRYFRDRWQQMSRFVRMVFALLLVLVANLPALALVGMEHTLQLLVAGVCAFAVAEGYLGGRISAICLVCAAVAPAIRYEDLAFTVAVCAACWFIGRRWAAVLTASLSILPLLLFGAFFHAHNLGWVPKSAVSEGRLLSAAGLGEHASSLGLLWQIARQNATAYLHEPQRWPIAFFFLLLCVQAWKVRKVRVRRNVLLGALAALALLMSFGPYGYFYRLDVAYRFFAFLLVFAIGAEYERFSMWPALTTGAVGASVYVLATLQVPAAAWATAHGQKQTQRFVQTFYRGNVLVTDPGWAAFDSRDRFEVLSADSLIGQDGAQLRSILASHHVQLAVLSPRVSLTLPPDWKPAAVLCRYGDGFNRMTIFRSPELSAEVLSNDLRAFAVSLPPGTWITYEDGSRSDLP